MRIVVLLKAISPITHMAKTEGNEAVLVTGEYATSEKGAVHVPRLSGNALRASSVRRVGAEWLVRRLGLHDKLDMHQLYFFIHGGEMYAGGGFENTRLIAEGQRVMPLFGLLGGCMPSQIQSGSLSQGFGDMVCRETRGVLPAEVLDLLPPVNIRSFADFVGKYQYTRGATTGMPEDLFRSALAVSEARKTLLAPEEAELEDEEEDSGEASDQQPDGGGKKKSGKKPKESSGQMIFSGRSVIPGAWFAFESFMIRQTEPAQVGAWLWSLRLWAAQKCRVGGQSSRGHGRFEPFILAGPSEAEQDELVAEYHRAVDERADDARRWIEEVFGPRPAKAKKGKAS
mgnify:FL=1